MGRYGEKSEGKPTRFIRDWIRAGLLAILEDFSRFDLIGWFQATLSC